MADRAENSYYDILNRVVTVPTVCEMWGKSKTVVYYHIIKDDLAAVQDGSTWLISLDSVIAYWGKPSNMPPDDPIWPIISPKRL